MLERFIFVCAGCLLLTACDTAQLRASLVRVEQECLAQNLPTNTADMDCEEPEFRRIVARTEPESMELFNELLAQRREASRLYDQGAIQYPEYRNLMNLMNQAFSDARNEALIGGSIRAVAQGLAIAEQANIATRYVPMTNQVHCTSRNYLGTIYTDCQQ